MITFLFIMILSCNKDLHFQCQIHAHSVETINILANVLICLKLLRQVATTFKVYIGFSSAWIRQIISEFV